jgi:HAE1 family hydrophobic/amphiphilic exporter-1
MLAASLLSIFFIPVSFDVIERMGNYFTKEKPAEKGEKQAPAVSPTGTSA